MTTPQDTTQSMSGTGAEAPHQDSSKPPIMWSWINAAAKHAVSACMKASEAGPLIFACVCLAIAFKNRNSRALQAAAATHTGPVLHRSLSMAALHGGRVAMQRIIDSAKARIDKAGLDDAARRMGELLREEPLSFSKLQREAAKLEMSGKEDDAAAMLRKAWEKADRGGQPHEAHELQMLLVEMLIYMGEYEEALRCKCLDDKEISDARRPLYMAVIYTILDNLNSARECHKEFQEIQSRFFDLPDSTSREGSLIFGAVHDFDKFVEVVNHLKEEIDHAHKVRPA